jgi:hypothetical protein
MKDMEPMVKMDPTDADIILRLDGVGHSCFTGALSYLVS